MEKMKRYKKLIILYLPILIVFNCAIEISNEFDNEVYDFSTLNLDTDSVFSIISWNIEHFPKEYDLTIEIIINAINAMNPDVICLQEIENSDYFIELVEKLDNYKGFLSESAYFNLNLALIYKSELLVEEVFEIYIDNKSAFPRPPQVLKINYHNENIIVINNHLKAQESGIDDDQRRIAASNLLEDYINLYYENENVIIIGDLNDEITDAENENVFWNFISKPESYLFVDMEVAQDTSMYYWSLPDWNSHVDHIIINNHLFDNYLHSNSMYKTIRIDDYFFDGWNGYDMIVSDHRPIALKLYFN